MSEADRAELQDSNHKSSAHHRGKSIRFHIDLQPRPEETTLFEYQPDSLKISARK
ncbi:hypothetical protein EKH55_5411 [Sinorhizobium alkalisoli]|nr:hypothetical protein EKH55_5411 [Sinorhizobium alkalisoli]